MTAIDRGNITTMEYEGQRIELSFGVIVDGPTKRHVSDSRTLIEVIKHPKLRKLLGKVEQVNHLIMPQEVTGGNHLHDKRELFYVLHGNPIFYCADPNTREVYEFPLKETMIFFIPSGVPHAIRNPNIENAELLELSDTFFNDNNPIISTQYKIIS